MNNRKLLIDSIHDIIKDNKVSIPDIVLALSQVITDLGLTLYNKESGEGLTTKINLDFLKLAERLHYTSPRLSTALILTAANMISWVEDIKE